jgi:uncharacterized protein YijF (DUF1287 family)
VNSGRQEFLKQFVSAAVERTHHAARYAADSVKIPYPGGDVPADTGVCSDEVIRAYHAVGVDLQKEVHEDMKQSFSSYPHPIKPSGRRLRSWRINHLGPRGNVPHIGIVLDQRSLLRGRYMIVHNVFWRIIRKSKSQHSIQTAIGSQYDLFTSVIAPDFKAACSGG